MRVIIDGHMLGRNEGGNERYVKGIIKGLSPLKNIKTRIYRSHTRGVVADLKRVFIDLPRQAEGFRADIVHATYIGPLWGRGRLVLTVHDFLFRRNPEFFSLKEQLVFGLLLPLCLKRTSAVIVPSNFVKKEAVKFYPWLKNKVFVTYEAADGVFSYKRSKKARKPYLLAFNSKNPKKNIARVIAAYGIVQKSLPQTELLVVGPRVAAGEGVTFVENVGERKLAQLYHGCECLVYFSLYEGFGLPILEAFIGGVAVVASDIPVHREIAGNAALFAKPKNPQDLADKIIKLLGNPSLKAKLVRKGRERAATFSWEKTGKETAAIYRRVLKP
ncbi:MAG TPA: glycosyltransferase family 1 protein [Patescibacteria group bacterium]|uniref:Glycosyl transferase family 1 domain-containing protein n=1 Tax=Candidatus Woesebacteria bacterium RBG_13_46_13 TaxID=1802479 RepID=A0A1F7X468_9BACT|nr:MAG: hypothetical protein A2Y68_00485 [Candidatus Woesebacteria bacterium RBG_13_46_13]HJX59391.1 glycosyltransferase family 1 protein [Patescibacteria group bacterium]